MTEQVERNSIKAWILAARPKTLTGAAAPVLISGAIAYNHGTLKIAPFIICLCFAFLMQIAANFINDLYDYLKGSDKEDRLGPERACSKGWISAKSMRTATILTLLVALSLGSALISYGGTKLIIIALLCVLFAYLYTGGPYPLAYKGFGDILVLIFFGIIPVCFTYYVMSGEINTVVFLSSVSCGLLIDTLLVVNNYRDRIQDKLSNKQTIIVKFGEPFGRYFYLTLGLISPLIFTFFVFYNHTFAAFLPLLYIIPHFITWRKMCKIKEGKALNTILADTSRNMLIMSLLVCVGFVADKHFTL
ncbi:MAG: 1,4-dihydroxy-2-naphthoate polyprenyltransferase [Bacteroides sp.]|nr:1,4-dihydroxy-2-naphthoate polyprenyltransferase [Bacteroides sp.]